MVKEEPIIYIGWMAPRRYERFLIIHTSREMRAAHMTYG